MCRHVAAPAIITQCYSKRADELGGCLLLQTEVICRAEFILYCPQVYGKKKIVISETLWHGQHHSPATLLPLTFRALCRSLLSTLLLLIMRLLFLILCKTYKVNLGCCWLCHCIVFFFTLPLTTAVTEGLRFFMLSVSYRIENNI